MVDFCLSIRMADIHKKMINSARVSKQISPKPHAGTKHAGSTKESTCITNLEALLANAAKLLKSRELATMGKPQLEAHHTSDINKHDRMERAATQR